MQKILIACYMLLVASKLYVRSTAGAKRSHAKHAYRYHACNSKYTSNSRLTVSYASENSWSEMAVRACGTLSYFHCEIPRVSAEIAAHGEFPAQREQYPNLCKCTAIFSLFTKRHSTICMVTVKMRSN